MSHTLSQHPLSAAFPAMSEEDFFALKHDIEVNGQREPVMVFEDQILDGWHRYRACVDLGIEPTKFNFAAEEDPVAFVKSQNLHRRHLTTSQRAAAVVALFGWVPAGRPNKGATIAPLSKVSALSSAAQASPRTIKDTIAAQKGGLLDPVKDGALTASEAAQIARGTPSKPKDKPEAKPDPMVIELEETQQAVSVLSEENDRLNDRLAVVAMEGTDEERRAASETIGELRAKIKTLEAELRAVKSSRDGYMSENVQLKRQCAAQRKELEKA